MSLQKSPFVSATATLGDPKSLPGIIGIIGGQDVQIQEYPYQVAVNVSPTSDLCNGAIIASDQIITSASCLLSVPIDQIQIRAGSSTADEGGSVHRAVNVFIHDKFTIDSDENDVAIIEVAPPFEIDRTRQPIELFGKDDKADQGVYANASGYGDFERRTPTDYKLRVVSIPILDQSCVFANTPGLICAGAIGKGPCWNDFGSPLTIGGRLAGLLISISKPCGGPNFSGQYTEIAHVREWIDEYRNRGHPTFSI
ncbi:hypothetical protein QAD02_008583 [Eretmocerus hayati]|uniref:Uncharacterized protein n=1 Tax=Eretmocerus hayati TaxID=131215 RepID=A0ACC2N771_9HYME|nr:hypothetical protein QAD02_008583 [Eretmocerus hayati]